MNDHKSSDEFPEKIIRQLNRDSADVDPAVAARLRESRMKALELNEKPSFLGLPRWLTVSGLATAVILVIAVSLWTKAPKPAPITMHPEDMEVLTAPDQIELYRDLDFYRWLEGGGNGS